MKVMLAVLAAFALAGCSMTPRPVTTPPPKPRIAAPSPVAMQDCAAPVKLKPGAATQAQVENAWGTDVDHLVDCGKRHKILVNYIRKRDAALAGQ